MGIEVSHYENVLRGAEERVEVGNVSTRAGGVWGYVYIPNFELGSIHVNHGGVDLSDVVSGQNWVIQLLIGDRVVDEC